MPVLDGIIEMAALALFNLVLNFISQSGALALFLCVFPSACDGEVKVCHWGSSSTYGTTVSRLKMLLL